MTVPTPKPNDGDNGGAPATPEPGTPITPAPAPTGDFDPTKLGDDDFSKVFDDPRTFNHPRFKELNTKAKKADKLEEQIEADRKKKLEEEGEYKTLAEERQAEIDRLKGDVDKQKVDNKLTAELTKAGCVDIEAALLLVNREGLKMTDSGIEGADAVVTALKEARGYLFGTTQPVGSGTNPADGSGTTPANTFYRSQLVDQKFYKANEAAILKAFSEGAIIDDISDPSKRPQ